MLRLLCLLLGTMLFCGMSSRELTAQSIEVSNANTSGAGAVWDCAWTMSDHTDVEITFKLIRNGQVIGTSQTWQYQSNGQDTFASTFGGQTPQTGDTIRAEARYTGGAAGTVYLEHSTVIQ